MLRFLQRRRRWKKPAPASMEGWIERYLDEQAHLSRQADPETAERRRLLELALDRNAQEVAPSARPSRPLWPKVALAVATLGAFMLAGLLLMPREDILTYQTGRGRQTSIMLSDSTRISLNHTTVLRVHPKAAGAVRLVDLEGEAFFQVERTGKPFVVETGEGTVHVLGTEFNVRTRDGALEVSVVHGKVSLTARDSTVILEADQIALCRAGEYPVPPVASPFAGEPGWMQGELLLYRNTLEQACREIEERFDVTVHLAPRASSAGTVTGKVECKNAEVAVSALAMLTGSRYTRENDVYTIY